MSLDINFHLTGREQVVLNVFPQRHSTGIFGTLQLVDRETHNSVTLFTTSESGPEAVRQVTELAQQIRQRLTELAAQLQACLDGAKLPESDQAPEPLALAAPCSSRYKGRTCALPEGHLVDHRTDPAVNASLEVVSWRTEDVRAATDPGRASADGDPEGFGEPNVSGDVAF